MTGGWGKTVQFHSVWILIIIVVLLLGILKIDDIKKNYTNLHHKVNQLERYHEKSL